MHTIVSGHHLNITSSLRAYVDGKLTRVGRHFDNIIEVHVILSVDKSDQKAEGTIHVNGGTLYADARAHDMYAAIDALAHKLDRQVKKHKEKNSSYQRRTDLLHDLTGA